MRGWKWKVVNPQRWEAAKFCAFCMTMVSAVACLGGLEWEPEFADIGEPFVPYPEMGLMFLAVSGAIAWRLGSTSRR
jgi:hypothetical protein